MRKTFAAALIAFAGLLTALTLTTSVGADNGRVGVDVAGVVAVEVSRAGVTAGPAASTEDSVGVWACAVHGNGECGPLDR